MTIEELWNQFLDALRGLFNTPIAGWTWRQWIFALFLLFVLPSCGRCLCCCCRGRRRGRRHSFFSTEDRYYNASHRKQEDEQEQELPQTRDKTESTSSDYRLAQDDVA